MLVAIMSSSTTLWQLSGGASALKRRQPKTLHGLLHSPSGESTLGNSLFVCCPVYFDSRITSYCC